MYEMYSLCIAEQVIVRDFRIRAVAFVLCIPHWLLQMRIACKLTASWAVPTTITLGFGGWLSLPSNAKEVLLSRVFFST